MPDELNPSITPVTNNEPVVDTTAVENTGTVVNDPPEDTAATPEPAPETPPEAPAVRMTVAEMIEHYKVNGTPQQKGFFETMADYSYQMRPMYNAAVSNQLLQQRQLFAAFLDLFGSYHGSDFGDYWKCVVGYGKTLAKDHGTFGHDNYLRHSYKLYGDEKALSQHKALMLLFVTMLQGGKKAISESVVMAKVEALGFEPNVMRGIHRAYL